MVALVVCALIALVILKPQEFIRPLQAIPLLYVLFGLAVVAIVFAVVYRKIRPALPPAIPLVGAFFGWLLLTTALKRPDALSGAVVVFAIVLGIYLAIAVGLTSASGLKLFSATILGCALIVTYVAIQQGRSFYGCMVAEPDDWEGKGELTWDGRECVTIDECKASGDPTANYRCEKVGPLGTSSVGGRVRYRGSLADPNELSLFAACAIPFAIALWQERSRKKVLGRAKPVKGAVPVMVSDRMLHRVSTFVRSIPTTAVIGAIAVAIVMSQSRGGLLVFLTVLGIYFVRKAGKWGVVAGCLMAAPLVLVGGRSGTEAEESAGERVELLKEAFEFIRESKGIGLGYMGFPDRSSIGLTAHNSYVLAMAEAGLVGAVLFSLVLYASMKVPVAIWFSDEGRFDGLLKRLAPVIAISIAGALVGILFLSWTYKDLLYILLAASAALYGVARHQDPTFKVGIKGKEVALVSVATMGLLGLVYLGTKLHG